MSTFRDATRQFVRHKDKDKNKDNASSYAGSSIVVKRNRHSISSSSKRTSSPDGVSQCIAGHTATGDPILTPPDSSKEPPLNRSSSNRSVPPRSSPSVVNTPASLQPYLESEAGDPADSVRAQSLEINGHRSRWIGPSVETDADTLDEELIPTFSSKGASRIPDKRPTASSSDDDTITGPSSLPSLPQRRPSVLGRQSSESRRSYSGPYHPQETTNPFLPIPANGQHHPSPQITRPLLQPVSGSHHHAAPSPASSQHSPPCPPQPSSVMSGSNADKQIAPTTYIGQTQPDTFHDSRTPNLDHSMLLLQKIASAMPDLYQLMQQHHQTCATLAIRETQVRNLEVQKKEDAARLGNRIEELGDRLQHQFDKDKAKITRLQHEVDAHEGLCQGLEKKLTMERGLKDEAKADHTALLLDIKQMKKAWMDERTDLNKAHSHEKSRMQAEHIVKLHTIGEHAESRMRIHEASVASRLDEFRKAHLEELTDAKNRHIKEKDDLEDRQAKACQELENALTVKQRLMDDERRDFTQRKQAMGTECDRLRQQIDENRTKYMSDLAVQLEKLSRRHQKEREDQVKSIEASHATNQVKAQGTIRTLERTVDSQSYQLQEAQSAIAKLQKDLDIHKRHHIEAQEVICVLKKERDDIRTALNTASRQRSESQQRLRQSQMDQSSYNIAVQEKPSELQRQRSDPQSQEMAKLQQEVLTEQSRNEEAQEAIARLHQELEDARSTSAAVQTTKMRGSSSPEEKVTRRTASRESSASQKELEKEMNMAEEKDISTADKRRSFVKREKTMPGAFG